MFDIHGLDRLVEWKNFRDSLETSDSPLIDTAILWSQAPFVSNYLPLDPTQWPDPWKLIIDGKFDSLGIALGELYTLQLTARFNRSVFEIYMFPQKKNNEFFLVVDNGILNWRSREVDDFSTVGKDVDIKRVWSSLDVL